MNFFKTVSVAIFVVLALCACSSISAENDATIALASFNVRVPVDKSPNTWEERLPRCREVIEKNNFDIVGVQEPVIAQVESLVKDPPYDYIGGGRDDFKRKGEFCAILYRRSRFECLQNGTFGLSETPDVPGVRSWQSACPRIATWGLFRDKTTGKEFIYYNTHLDHKSEPARCEGIKLIVEHAKKHAAGKPIILSGDFNTRPDTETYKTAQSLLHDSRLISATPHEGPDKTFHGWGKSKITQPIDFIFVSDEFEVHSHRTIDTLQNGVYASDHHPVAVTLTLK